MAGHTRTRTGCWTCREAGYKCDEQKPHCGRCIRLKKQCKGYGLKIKWRNAVVTTPDQRSKREKRGRSFDNSSKTSPKSASSPLSVVSVASAPAILDNAAHPRTLDLALAPVTMPSLAPDLSLGDQRLLHYWIHQLSSLISVAPRKGGTSPFQFHLASMTYNHGALRSTVLAMAANHLAQVSDDKTLRFQGYRHQRDAIHLLQQLIQDPYQAGSEPALATVLMMQISARLFGDEEEAHAANHLVGAKAMILRRGGLAAWRASPGARFLLSLFAYHDILSSVSRSSRPLVDHEADFNAVEGAESMESIAQVLHVVARISELQDKTRAERASSDRSALSESTFAVGTEIQQNMLSMDFPLDADAPAAFTDINRTAQAYRQAAFIYLYRVWLEIGAPNPNTLNHVQQCITYIEQVPIDSPLISAHVWPLFTAGCEAVDSTQRQFVRDRFKEMYISRKFPSMKRVMSDIEDVWAAKDMEHVTNGLDGMSKVDCIQVILQRRGREVDLA